MHTGEQKKPTENASKKAAVPKKKKDPEKTKQQEAQPERKSDEKQYAVAVVDTPQDIRALDEQTSEELAKEAEKQGDADAEIDRIQNDETGAPSKVDEMQKEPIGKDKAPSRKAAKNRPSRGLFGRLRNKQNAKEDVPKEMSRDEKLAEEAKTEPEAEKREDDEIVENGTPAAHAAEVVDEESPNTDDDPAATEDDADDNKEDADDNGCVGDDDEAAKEEQETVTTSPDKKSKKSRSKRKVSINTSPTRIRDGGGVAGTGSGHEEGPNIGSVLQDYVRVYETRRLAARAIYEAQLLRINAGYRKERPERSIVRKLERVYSETPDHPTLQLRPGERTKLSEFEGCMHGGRKY